MRGRKPKPLARQIAEGDPRKKGKERLQEQLVSEPIASRGLPDPPAHLVGVAWDAWVFWKEELKAMNLDARPDAMMLEGACVNYARAVDADQIIGREGAVLDEPVFVQGVRISDIVRKRKHPAVTVSNAAWSQVKAFCCKFGLSPVSRARLTLDKPDHGDTELWALLTKPRLKREPNSEKAE